jgi:hypothetical protein
LKRLTNSSFELKTHTHHSRRAARRIRLSENDELASRGGKAEEEITILQPWGRGIRRVS